MKNFFKVFIFASIAFSLIFITGFFLFLNGNESEDIISRNIKSIMNSDKEESITFLLLGVDANDIAKEQSVRTDTMMLVKYDNDTNFISILSIPRDTKAFIRGRQHEEKINHAHAYGGPELSVKAVKDLLGVNVDYYVRVDYKIVKDLVDIIGGVEIDVPMNMVYSDPYADPPLRINLKKGLQTLDGDKALQFLRYRKGYADQDLGRIHSQQEFMKAAIKQALNPKNILKLPQIVSTYSENVDTNIPADLIVKLGLKAKDFNTENLNIITLQGETKMINGVWYFIPNEQEKNEVVRSMFIDNKSADMN